MHLQSLGFSIISQMGPIAFQIKISYHDQTANSFIEVQIRTVAEQCMYAHYKTQKFQGNHGKVAKMPANMHIFHATGIYRHLWHLWQIWWQIWYICV